MKLAITFFAAGVVIILAAAALAGPLTPPVGPVAPTGKTTQEVFDKVAAVEPRIAVDATNTPGDTVGSPSVFKITQPGSYYLTGNVTVPAVTRGIVITANNVSLDLSGFTITGMPGAVAGIISNGSLNNITILNGTVETCAQGLNLASTNNGRIEGVQVQQCTSEGVRVGAGFHLRNCKARSNTGYGFFASTNCTIESCIATSNTLDGFFVGAGSVLRGCVAASNVGDGFSGLSRSVISDCIATSNQVGFALGSFTIATNNTSTFNVGVGFEISSNSTITGNNASNNGSGAVASAGYLLVGSNVRLEGNNSASNDVGFQVTGTSNIIIRNTASANTTGWIIAAGNSLGPIVSATTNAAQISGSTAASTLGSTDPNTNFTY